ncbi:MAG: DUF1513 domain-containing protein [Pseudomonadota bacterium]
MAGFNDEGDVVLDVPISFRAHEIVISPDKSSAIAVARRPGVELVRIELPSGRLLQNAMAAAKRHFYGHSVFSADGQLLFTAENDYDNARGVIGVRRSADLQLVNEFGSYGLGPHELKLSTDKQTLIVANGGILTHPAQGREKLNVGSMQPNLAFINSVSGELVESVAPDFRQNSVRHIDVLADDTVLIGMQQSGDEPDQALIAIAKQGPTLETLDLTELSLREMRRYSASVCADPRTGYAVATCPRGNIVTFWDIEGESSVGSVRIPDAAGVCLHPERNEFVVSTGRGMIYRIDSKSLKVIHSKTRRHNGMRWDNHLSSAFI